MTGARIGLIVRSAGSGLLPARKARPCTTPQPESHYEKNDGSHHRSRSGSQTSIPQARSSTQEIVEKPLRTEKGQGISPPGRLAGGAGVRACPTVKIEPRVSAALLLFGRQAYWQAGQMPKNSSLWRTALNLFLAAMRRSISAGKHSSISTTPEHFVQTR